MSTIKKLVRFQSIAILLCINFSMAQIASGTYFSDLDNVRHELKITETYLIHTIYEKDPARFIKTTGGFYTIEDSEIIVTLEFNSNFEGDGLQKLVIPFAIEDETLVLALHPKLSFKLANTNTQDLEGQWLFGTRGPDKGQERRGETNTRKTLKYLQDGRFQWIAYDTDGMKFKGTGGGSFTSIDGIYTENIEFFSRDNNRVGASLEFNYEIKSDDWHHTGKNSKGEPMYEIWVKRKAK